MDPPYRVSARGLDPPLEAPRPHAVPGRGQLAAPSFAMSGPRVLGRARRGRTEDRLSFSMAWVRRHEYDHAEAGTLR